MIDTMKVKKENLYAAAQKGFLNATDLADYLVRKGLPFRSAYKMVGSLVATCIATGKTLEDLSLAEYRATSDLFEADLYTEISLETCVAKRISAGSTGPDSVDAQIASVKVWLEKE
jgi:argininosuccinate lyase